MQQMERICAGGCDGLGAWLAALGLSSSGALVAGAVPMEAKEFVKG
jgi:hypothetical protein